jgi:hypothetical protein
MPFIRWRAEQYIEKAPRLFWLRLIMLGGFGLLGLVAAIASIAHGLRLDQ